MGLYTSFFIGLVYLWTVTGALALGFPIPQPKPCKIYWDGPAVHKVVASTPGVERYIATPEMVIEYIVGTVQTHVGQRKVEIVRVHSHTDKGCYQVQTYQGNDVGPWLKLLTDQEDA